MIVPAPEAIEAKLARHEKVALQFSGGKDSMATLFLVKPWLERITVYWLNTGDPMPETLAAINECRKFIPHFVEVKTDVAAWRERYGDPSDLVPTYGSPLGLLMGFGKVAVSDRFSCCWSNVMLPMAERMKADGVTLLIRGTKAADMPRLPMKTGDVATASSLFLPMQMATDEEILDFLKEAGAPVHACYEDGNQGVDCMHCTAWWNEGHFRFLKKRHPDTFVQVITKVGNIARAIDTHCDDLRALSEMSGGPDA
jgi:3'-phosphoadenosine 5'-phosphosulfate sulfotransferase (PAPS reductase)/FAD synthetase